MLTEFYIFVIKVVKVKQKQVMLLWLHIIYKFRIFDIGEAERLKTKQLMMIPHIKTNQNILSSQSLARAGWARGSVTISPPEFPQICEIFRPIGALDWPVIQSGLTNPVSAPPSLVSRDWHVLTMCWPLVTPGMCSHWPVATPPSPHSSWPGLTRADQGEVWSHTPICCPPPSLMSPLKLFVMQIKPPSLCIPHPMCRSAGHRWSVLICEYSETENRKN